jgi:hypothetical protein
MSKFDFEDVADPIEAEKLFAVGNKTLDQAIVVLQHARMPSAVAGQIETKRAEFNERMEAWEHYKETHLKPWLANWPKVQQEINDRATKLDRKIFKALRDVKNLCRERADAAVYKRRADLKYAELGPIGHEEKTAIRMQQIRVNGKVIAVSAGGEAVAGEVFAIFADFAKAHADLTPFIGE